ncbi:hypothetical protein RclHR1_06900006 [Rhizophagus clarus]|uniref:Uncharacterized protein n=1 Tax=Rhizophagus clarus TaxID=94130 RepID=A0A2Z6S0D1_9GLOM|nr:hypothetical protein RclHR1_06900006 [Rhizophagus clarus]GES73779.1 hypothetical protein GLOIN_2v1847651 [Rhizophagus clarus]
MIIHNDLTINASGRDFILRHSIDKPKEKRLFLCILLGYDVQRTHYILDNKFPSGSFLNALEDYKQKTLPLDTKEQMYTAIMTLVHHNAFQMKYDWFIIFIIANEIDPNYTFIDRLKSLKYSNENLAMFIERCKTIKPYNENIKFECYAKIAKWLIRLCHNMDSLLILWNDVLFHNSEIDRNIFKCFIEQIQECISHDDAVDLKHHFKRIPADYRYDVLYWGRDEVIQSLESISQSYTLELLNSFPKILEYCFHNDLSDTEEEKISESCIVWFKNLIKKLNASSSNESDLIFSMFQQLELVHPFLNQKDNIWGNLSDIALERTKNCPENQIFDAIKFVVQINQNDVKKLFLNIVQERLKKHYTTNG